MLTGFAVRRMRRHKPGSPAWRRWYAVYRSLPHWRWLRARLAHGRRLELHHTTYATLGRERPGRDVIVVTPRQHRRIHGRRS